jgi:hypothetical protein
MSLNFWIWPSAHSLYGARMTVLRYPMRSANDIPTTTSSLTTNSSVPIAAPVRAVPRTMEPVLLIRLLPGIASMAAAALDLGSCVGVDDEEANLSLSIAWEPPSAHRARLQAGRRSPAAADADVAEWRPVLCRCCCCLSLPFRRSSFRPHPAIGRTLAARRLGAAERESVRSAIDIV